MSEDKRYDILGREIKDGDICVGKGTGRDVIGMDVGIWCGKSIAFLGGSKRSMGDVFKIVNPSKEEIEIADKIKADLSKRKEENKKKEKTKGIPLSQLTVGGIYEDINRQLYVYLGKRKVTVTCGSRKRVEEGNCFSKIYRDIGTSKSEVMNQITWIQYYGKINIDILKTSKKLISLKETVDLTFPIKTTYSIWNEDYTLTVE